MDSYIEVTGTGVVTERAKTFRAQISIEATGTAKALTIARASSVRNEAVRLLREGGLRDDELVEGGAQVWRPWWRSRTKQEVSHKIFVRCDDYERLIRAIALLEPLSNEKDSGIELQMHAPVFESTEEEKNAARAAALREARGKADVLASEAGLRVTGVLRIQESDGVADGRYGGREELYSMADASPGYEHEALEKPSQRVEHAFRVWFAVSASEGAS